MSTASTASAASVANPVIEVIPAVIQSSSTPHQQLLGSHRATALTKLYGMADALYHSGERRRAMSIFSSLMNNYPESPEAELAYARMIEVAGQYEHEGELRLAQSIYEELL